MAKFIWRIALRNSPSIFFSRGGFVMAAPRKPKSAGVRTAKSKAKPATRDAPITAPAAASPAANGNGPAAPSAEMIRLRAYEVFVARNGTTGDELSDWLTAEREIMESFASSAHHVSHD